MYKFGVLMIFIALLLEASASSKKPVVQPKFRISYSGSQEGQVYSRFIQSIYEDLGFKVTIIQTPVKRGLILLNDNKIDADVIRLKSAAKQYKNVVIVKPAIASGLLVLLCNKKEPCDENILQNTAAYIQSDEGNLNLFESGQVKATIIFNEMPANTLNMLEEERILYALYSMNNRMLEMLSAKFNYVILKDVSGYHVINKKHAHLLPALKQKIQQKLPELQASLE
jgi:hypothetical protein